MRRGLTDADVWEFVVGGCNAHEIAAYAGVSMLTAHSMIAAASRRYARLELAA